MSALVNGLGHKAGERVMRLSMRGSVLGVERRGGRHVDARHVIAAKSHEQQQAEQDEGGARVEGDLIAVHGGGEHIARRGRAAQGLQEARTRAAGDGGKDRDPSYGRNWVMAV